MITVNGKEITVAKSNDKREKEVNKWVKAACDRIFSHYPKGKGK